MLRPRTDGWLPAELGRVHLVGVGGSGMSGIARILHERGLTVTGSDRAESEVTESLRECGVPVFIGDHSGYVAEADTVISTYAVRDTHPEIIEATARGIPILHRADALRFITQGRRLIAVAGSHGKTTTTAILATAMDKMGIDVGVVNGGVIAQWGVSSRHGNSEWFVIEADESDRSFVIYHPEIALITNVAADHLDFYGSLEAVHQAFEDYARTASSRSVICLDDPGSRTIANRVVDRFPLTYGTSEDAQVRLTSVEAAPQASGTVEYLGETATFVLAVPGRLNALNATGVIASLLAAGFSLSDAAHGVSGFQGAIRRFQFHADIAGIRVYDDHAHHPTEVRTALEIAQSLAGEGRVITMFQPHLYTRTQIMASELAQAFSEGSDHTIFFDIFGSREEPIEGVTTQLILDRLAPGTSFEYEPDWDRAVERAVAYAQPGDLVLTMSTGDLYQIVPRLVTRLKSAHGDT